MKNCAVAVLFALGCAHSDTNYRTAEIYPQPIIGEGGRIIGVRQKMPMLDCDYLEYAVRQYDNGWREKALCGYGTGEVSISADTESDGSVLSFIAVRKVNVYVHGTVIVLTNKEEYKTIFEKAAGILFEGRTQYKLFCHNSRSHSDARVGSEESSTGQ